MEERQITDCHQLYKLVFPSDYKPHLLLTSEHSKHQPTHSLWRSGYQPYVSYIVCFTATLASRAAVFSVTPILSSLQGESLGATLKTAAHEATTTTTQTKTSSHRDQYSIVFRNIIQHIFYMASQGICGKDQNLEGIHSN